MGRHRVRVSFHERDFHSDDEYRDDVVSEGGKLVIQSTEYNKLSVITSNTKKAKRFCTTFIVHTILMKCRHDGLAGKVLQGVVGVRGDKRDLTKVVIPDGIEVIGPAAFSDCERLKSVVLPESVQRVCRIAFLRCRNLSSVSLPNGLETVERYAFAGCTKLEKVIFRPPAGKATAVFIVWAVSVGKNRDNFHLTIIKRLRNVLRLITGLASESRVPSSIAPSPRALAATFAGCSRLSGKLGMTTNRCNFVSDFLNAEVSPDQEVDLSMHKTAPDVIDLTLHD